MDTMTYHNLITLGLTDVVITIELDGQGPGKSNKQMKALMALSVRLKSDETREMLNTMIGRLPTTASPGEQCEYHRRYELNLSMRGESIAAVKVELARQVDVKEVFRYLELYGLPQEARALEPCEA